MRSSRENVHLALLTNSNVTAYGARLSYRNRAKRQPPDAVATSCVL
jgi:hypothetical protein